MDTLINTACAKSLSLFKGCNGWPGRGVAQKNVWCLMELYEDVLQNSLLSCILLFLAWAYFSAAIIMIFVSCTNINGYLRNYQDCLTLGCLT
jgi:hypothetical protein